MKSVIVILISILGISVANARVCTLNQTTTVREDINGKSVGQVRASTPVNIIGYDMDNQGKMFTYVTWQGQPLSAIKRQGMQSQGWVNKEAVSCSN